MLKKWWYSFHDKKLKNKKLQFVNWFHSKYPYKYCWSDCVGWAFSATRFNPFKIDSSKACKTESERNCQLSCYCGAWQNGKCLDKLTKQEKQDYEKGLSKQLLNTELPF